MKVSRQLNHPVEMEKRGNKQKRQDMTFSKEFLDNKMFTDHALSFEKPKREEINGTFVDTGAILQENGDYLFRIYAPEAKDVRLLFNWVKEPLILAKTPEGFFEGTYVYNPALTGPVSVRVMIDGALFISPYIPVFWSSDRPMNYIEVPDPEMEFAMIRDVPHGSYIRELYWADNLQNWARCMVYTPPGYMNGTKSYPVLYLLHGGTDNETSWQYNGNVADIMDNLIAAGECEPCIVVMNNGMLRYDYDEKNDVWDLALEDLLTGSCIPYIEKTYRVKTGKWDRAIAGLSMGAYQANDIGLRHPELFGYIGQFTASITQDPSKWNYKRNYREMLSDPKKFLESYKVFFRSTTPNEDHLEYYEADDALYQEAGVDSLPNYYRILYPEGTSRWKSWRTGLRDYVKLIFKEG